MGSIGHRPPHEPALLDSRIHGMLGKSVEGGLRAREILASGLAGEIQKIVLNVGVGIEGR